MFIPGMPYGYNYGAVEPSYLALDTSSLFATSLPASQDPYGGLDLSEAGDAYSLGSLSFPDLASVTEQESEAIESLGIVDSSTSTDDGEADNLLMD